MSNLKLLATATALGLSLSPIAFADATYTGASQGDQRAVELARQQHIAALPVWTPAAAHDYTGEAPAAPEGAHVARWTSASAHNYVGDGSAPSNSEVARAPLWNAASARDYTGEVPHL